MSTSDWLKQVLEEADKESAGDAMKDKTEQAKREAVETAQRSGDTMAVLRTLRSA